MDGVCGYDEHILTALDVDNHVCGHTAEHAFFLGESDLRRIRCHAAAAVGRAVYIRHNPVKVVLPYRLDRDLSRLSDFQRQDVRLVDVDVHQHADIRRHRNDHDAVLVLLCGCCRCPRRRHICRGASHGGIHTVGCHAGLACRRSGGVCACRRLVVFVIVNPQDRTVKRCPQRPALIQAQQLQQGLFLLLALPQHAVVMGTVAGIRQIEEDARCIHQHVFAEGNLGYRPSEAGHPKHAVDGECAAAEFNAVFIQDTDFFVDFGSVVRHQYRHEISDPFFHTSVDHVAVCPLHSHFVTGGKTVVLKLCRHFPVQGNQGQSAVFHHTGRHIRLCFGVDLFHPSRDTRRHVGIHPVSAGGGQFLIQLVQLLLDRRHCAKNRSQVQRSDQITFPQFVV